MKKQQKEVICVCMVVDINLILMCGGSGETFGWSPLLNG